MRKLVGVLITILLIGLLILVFGFDHTSAKERSRGNLSFSVQTNRVIYDEALKMITVPVRPNKTLTSQKVRVLLTYGWDGNGHSEKVIGETVLTKVDWFSGVENYLRIHAEMAIDEIKSMDKVDLVVIYDGETTITENLKPGHWQVTAPPSSNESTTAETSKSSNETVATSASSSSIEPKFSESQSTSPTTSEAEITSEDIQSTQSTIDISDSETVSTQPVTKSEPSQTESCQESAATAITSTEKESASSKHSDSQKKTKGLPANQSQKSQASVSSSVRTEEHQATTSSQDKKEQLQPTEISSGKEVNAAVLPKTGSKTTNLRYLLFGLVVVLTVFLYWLKRKLFYDEKL
ncbi:LPXTG cell wall anchor domain-containing protein [Enterococcus casseliflavus]|uniref:LPXTG cell wall anchor domain-containing protein n=1 Tax=Enterococcus sp. 4E1_DIV0656 TaxID=1834180 RepID=UPI000A37F813|nr:LPXTG cell wall anchor domain-containing protein [Enterococcus sp. 4E1_DIV0656]MEC5316671.1 LPXTG cell wall anchor domain-containing protein [Enterococcus casseliflavus]OTO11040.1 hypothetical protein A5882_002964 [Enterococcus sp. 4E1_DIV0656]